MADTAFDGEFVDLYPSTFVISIKDTLPILRQMIERSSDVYFRLSEESPSFAHLKYQFRPIDRDVENIGRLGLLRHETNRTAAEFLVALEVQRRLGVLLANISEFAVGTYPNAGDFSIDPQTGLIKPENNYINRLFDFTTQDIFNGSSYTEFQTLEIHLNSPLHLKSTPRRIHATSLTPETDKTARKLAIVSCVTAILSLGVATAALGFTIYQHTTNQEQAILQAEDSNYSALRNSLGQRTTEGNKRLQKCLDGLGYYKGRIDGVIGPMTRDAAKRFGENHRLLLSYASEHFYENPRFLQALARVAAINNVKCN